MAAATSTRTSSHVPAHRSGRVIRPLPACRPFSRASVRPSLDHVCRRATGGQAARLRLMLPLLLALLCALPTLAQCEHRNTAFRAGEDLRYDLYFNWHFIWVKAGTAHYTVSAADYGGQPALRTDLLFQGSRRLNAVFPMQDTLRSYMSPALVPLYFRKGATEGSRYTVDEVFYSYPGGRSHVEQHHRNRHGRWSTHQHESEECNYDMLSILNVARSFDPTGWVAGHQLHFPMTTGKRVERQTLIFRGREDWKANDGKTYRCLVFTLLDYDERDKQKELLRFYVTDDANHLPVRIDFYLRFGTAKAFFASGAGIRNPQTSVRDPKTRKTP